MWEYDLIKKISEKSFCDDCLKKSVRLIPKKGSWQWPQMNIKNRFWTKMAN